MSRKNPKLESLDLKQILSPKIQILSRIVRTITIVLGAIRFAYRVN